MSEPYSRRDFLKTAGAGLALAILTACAPVGQQDRPASATAKPPEGLRPGEMSRKPYLMINGEPTTMDDASFKLLEEQSLLFPLPDNEVPIVGRGNRSKFISHVFGDYMRTTIPYASLKNGVMLRGPISYDISYQKSEFSAGWFIDKDTKIATAVIDATATDQNDVLVYNTRENRNWFTRQTKPIANVPKEIEENFEYRNTAETLDNRQPRIPGDANFIYTMALYLNNIGKNIQDKLQPEGKTAEQIAEAIYNARVKGIESLFSDNVAGNLLQFYQNDLGFDMSDPSVSTPVTEYINFIAPLIESYKQGMRYIRTPEMAMSVLQSLNMIDYVGYNPTDSESSIKNKQKLIEGYRQLVQDIDSGLPAQEAGAGVWEVKWMGDINKGKEDFWVEIPQEKPRAVVVQRKQDYQVNKDNGQGTPVPQTKTRYQTDIIYLFSDGNRVVKSTKSENGPVQPADYLSDDLLARSLSTTEKDISDQGFDLKSEGWDITAVNEISNQDIRLYHLPDTNQLQWGIENKNSGMREAVVTGNWADFGRLMSFGDSFYYQELLLDNGKEFANSGSKWASDVTDKWKKLVAEGNDRATRFGLLSPQEFVNLSSKGFLVPSDSNIRDLFANLRQQEIIDKTKAPYSYGFVIAKPEETIPVLQISTGNTVGHFSNGDMFSYYEPTWIQTADGKKPYLLIDPDRNFAIPMDIHKLQLIDSGLGEKGWDFAKQAFPWILTAIGIGPKIPGAIGKILQFAGILK